MVLCFTVSEDTKAGFGHYYLAFSYSDILPILCNKEAQSMNPAYKETLPSNGKATRDHRNKQSN